MVSLLEFRDYLKAHGKVSEQALAQHFHTTPAMIASMGEHLVAKGKAKVVKSVSMGGCGSSCCQCDTPPDTRIWIWIR